MPKYLRSYMIMALIMAVIASGAFALVTEQAQAQSGGIEASQDAHIKINGTSTPGEASLALRGAGSQEHWAIFKFTGVTAGTADIRVRVTTVRTGTLSLFTAGNNWAESPTFTWANKPAIGSTALSTKPQPATPGDVTFNNITVPAGDVSFWLKASYDKGLTFVAAREHTTLAGPTLLQGTAPTTTTVAPTTTTVAPTTTTAAPTTTIAPTTTTIAPSGCIGGTLIPSGQSIQAALNANGPGLFCLEANGRYREGNITPGAGDTIQGPRSAVVDGTKLVTNWVQDGTRWKSTGQTFTPDTMTDPLVCADSPAACHFVDLFGSGERLTRVMTNTPGPGQWGFDYATDTVWLGSDPASYTSLELSNHKYAFAGDHWTLKGFTIAKFARSGTTDSSNPSDARVLDGIESRYNHDAGWHVGTDDQILNSVSTHNGRYGFTCGGGERSVLDGVEVSYANDLYFSSIRNGGSWDEGAFKCVFTTDLVIRNMYSHHNYGHGGWADINNKQMLIENSRFEDNLLHGYFHEISCSIEIRTSTFLRNGAYNTWTGPKKVAGDQLDYGWEGAGISVSSSRDANIHDNTLDGNVTGITLVEDGRTGGANGCTWGLFNNQVRHNSVRQPNSRIAAGYFWGVEAQQQNNPFIDNDYILPSTGTAAFNWWTCSCNNAKTFSQWQGFGQDQTGSVTVG